MGHPSRPEEYDAPSALAIDRRHPIAATRGADRIPGSALSLHAKRNYADALFQLRRLCYCTSS
jgi:hypothetical protein